ncbi:MAG: alpha/beta hydrolase [Candidatus Woesearchaeota archaeon]|nr:MAG: alpha/beta hydrolase [Candidatus Woesearchaeota archaeon]
MKALVLSGGSIKGAYQVGVLYELLSQFKPDTVFGISVGSLNSLLLLSSYIKSNGDFNSTATMMYQFWKNNITCPNDIINKKSNLRLAKDIITNKFESIVDVEPLKSKIISYLKGINIVDSGKLVAYSGAVDFNTGVIKYVNNRHPDYLEYALASSAIPIQMPPVISKRKILYDGGLVDVIPIRAAIHYGATELLIVSTHPRVPSYSEVRMGNVFDMLTRTIDIMVSNIIADDLKLLDLYNNALDSVEGKPSWLKDKIKIKYKLICPENPLNIDILNFNKEDIEYMLKKGRIDAVSQYSN